MSGMDITSANATAVMTIDELYPAGIRMQQFSTDAGIVSESLEVAETQIGVDGIMAAGVTPNILPITITLQPNSETTTAFEHLMEATNANRRLYECNLTIKLPSVGKTLQFSHGVLKTGNPMPSINRVLAPTTWVFHFERMEVI